MRRVRILRNQTLRRLREPEHATADMRLPRERGGAWHLRAGLR